MYGISYMCHLKQNNTKELTLQNREKFVDLENKPVIAVGAGGWGQGTLKEFGMDVYTLLYLKRITNKDLLYSTGNSAQCYVAAWMGGELGGEWIHVYVWLGPFSVHLKLSQHG